MRARFLVLLLASAGLVFALVAASLITPVGAPVPAWASSFAWNDLGGPAGGPAQAAAFNPAFPGDPVVLAGGGQDVGQATWDGFGLFRSLDGGLTWADRSGPPGGALLDVAFSPAWLDDGFALAGFWQGVWSTSDRGATWQQLSNLGTQAPSFVTAVAVASPAAGMHTLLAGGPYGGVYRSADEGTTWDYNGDPGGIYRLRFHPTQPDIALAATNTGLWRSTDAGLLWTRVSPPTIVYDVAFAEDGTAVASFDGYAWRSVDDGATWQQLSTPAVDGLGQIGLSDDGATLFAAAGRQIYRFNSGTGEFIPVDSSPALGRVLRLAVSPAFADDQTLLVGTYDGVWRSTDAGQSFVRSAGFTPLPSAAIASVGNTLAGDLYAGTEYGLWRHSGSTWEPLNAGLELGGAPPIGSLALSPTYAEDHTVFVAAGSNSGLGASLYRTTDRGASWLRLAGAEYIDQVVISPAFGSDRRVFMVANQRISVSSDGGDTWTSQRFWSDEHTARSLAASPNYAVDRTLVAVGNQLYRSTDSGDGWSVVSAPPPISAVQGVGWQPGHLYWGPGGRLYLTLYSFETVAPFVRHDQLWSSDDNGETWSRVAAAPDLPVGSLASGPTTAGSGTALYLSTFDANPLDDPVIARDVYVSRDDGASWANLGAVPGAAPAVLLAPTDVADRLWAGSRGVWLLETAQMPTATPSPLVELLSNRSFEYQGVWRIPLTAYSAAYSSEQHFAGWWSMRTGIADPAANVRSYSDFSQDVTLPLSSQITLRLHRWPASGITASSMTSSLSAALAASTLDEFYQLLATTDGDLQYALLIEQPSNKIHFLYARLGNEQAWVEETFDITRYAGQQVRLQFGTYNDGSGPVALQYFDVLALQALAPPSPTPVPTPTTTPVEDRYWWLPLISRDQGGTIPPAPAP